MVDPTRVLLGLDDFVVLDAIEDNGELVVTSSGGKFRSPGAAAGPVDLVAALADGAGSGG